MGSDHYKHFDIVTPNPFWKEEHFAFSDLIEITKDVIACQPLWNKPSIRSTLYQLHFKNGWYDSLFL